MLNNVTGEERVKTLHSGCPQFSDPDSSME